MSVNWEVVCLRAQGKIGEAVAALDATPNPLNANLYRACGALVALAKHPEASETEAQIAETIKIAGEDKVDLATVNAGVALHFIVQALQGQGGDLSGPNFAEKVNQLLGGQEPRETVIRYLMAASDPSRTLPGAWGSILARRLLKALG